MLNIKCSVSGISPKPVLTIVLSDDQLVQSHERAKQTSNGLYDVNLTAKVERESLVSPTALTCTINIPNTNYTKRKSTLYYGKLNFSLNNIVFKLKCIIYIIFLFIDVYVFNCIAFYGQFHARSMFIIENDFFSIDRLICDFFSFPFTLIV